MIEDDGPRPWTCAYCGGRLAWTANSVGCRRCHTIVKLAHADDHDREQSPQFLT